MKESLLERLKDLPEYASLTLEDEIALSDYLRWDASEGEELFTALAEYSPRQARVILDKVGPSLSRYSLQNCQRIIEQFEEAHQAHELASLSTEDLEARLALQALLPQESTEAKRMKRVLTRVLMWRDPAHAVEQLETSRRDADDYDFHRMLLRELFWHFHNTEPSLALRCLIDTQDAQSYLTMLLGRQGTPYELCAEVLERRITLPTPGASMEDQLQALITQIARSAVPYRLKLFGFLGRHTDQFGPTLVERLIHVGYSLSRSERRQLASSLQQEAIPLLRPQDRKKASRQLFRARLGL